MGNTNWAKKTAVNGDRLPPHSPEAEMGVLGCVFIAPELMAKCRERIKRHDAFFLEQNAILWRAFCEGHTDLLSLDRYLKAKGLSDVVSHEWISEIQDRVPSAVPFPKYLDDLLEQHQRRRIYQSAAAVEAMAHDEPLEHLEFYVKSEFGDALDGHRDITPPFEPAEIVAAQSTPRPTALVQGLLHVGSKLCIGGGSKSFKSWALLDLAMAVATGSPWLDLPTVKGRVLFINFEIQSAFFEYRLQTLAESKFFHAEALRNLTLWNLRGHRTSYDVIIPQLIERLTRNQGAPYALIVFDPLYKMYRPDQDENGASDSAALLNEIERVCSQFGAAAAYGTHFSKGNQATKNSIDRISGSGVFARDPDSLLMFTAHAEPDAFAVEATLRNFARLEPFTVRWDYPCFVRCPELDPGDLKQATGKKDEPKKKAFKAEDLLALLPIAPGLMVKEELVSARPVGMSKADAWDFITIMLDKGMAHEHRVKRHQKRDLVKIGRHIPTQQEEMI